MKQMGIAQEDIPVSKVIIEKTDGNKLIIEPAQVTKIKMQGQETFQVIGETKEETGEKFSEEDIKTIVGKTGKTEEEAKKALDETGDLADAIMKLS